MKWLRSPALTHFSFTKKAALAFSVAPFSSSAASRPHVSLVVKVSKSSLGRVWVKAVVPMVKVTTTLVAADAVAAVALATLLGATRFHARRARCDGDVRAGLRLREQTCLSVSRWASLGFHARRRRRGDTDVRAEVLSGLLVQVVALACGIHARPHRRGGADVRAAALFQVGAPRVVRRRPLRLVARDRGARVAAEYLPIAMSSQVCMPFPCDIAIGCALTRAVGQHTNSYTTNRSQCAMWKFM